MKITSNELKNTCLPLAARVPENPFLVAKQNTIPLKVPQFQVSEKFSATLKPL
jgi:hypothetical protein